ncbi:MAG: metallophosphoesterase family protein [Bacteroidota bacterium]
MKKILLLSDTHHHLDESILTHCREADEIWHAGDIGSLAVADKLASIKPLKAVWGNIDDDKLRMTFEEHLVFYCEEVKIYITHIGGTPGKYNDKVKSVIRQEKPDIFICGHSHILRVQRDPVFPMLYINPGAAGYHGFHKTRTMIRFKIEGRSPRDMEVIELGSRGSLA